ncbi:MAG: ThiF family adenylyltransferase, partial [Pseudomonadota bacterium]
MSEDFSERFGGIRRLYGVDGAEIIRRSHFCVVGIGGVGSWVVEALARTGVGAITFIDHDDIAVSNTNRQLHTLSSTIDLSKSEVMAERV